MSAPTLTADEITLPIKRTDGESLEDRLTANAYQNILPARYLKKDADGNVVETQEDLFVRVSRNIALAEAVYEAERRDVAIEVTPEQLKPGHPRRDELAEEVFGTGVDSQEGATTRLTEHNVNKFAYETIVPELPEEIREHVESVATEFQEQMESLSFMPNSPTLMNAGDELQQLSACFVDSPQDDITDIHETAKEAAEVFQSGGGMGYAFWRLRPYGDSVGSTGGIASGPLTFMETFDQMCETIAQGGTRRGAQMAIMRVSHPDVIEFVHAKNKDVSLAHSLKLNDPDDYTYTTFNEALEEARTLIDDDGRVPKHLRNAVEGHLSNFNISVGVTDEFMEALQNGEEYTFINPRTGEPHVATEHTKEMYARYGLGDHVEVGEALTLPASLLWERIVEGAYENGEPGVIYLDRVNQEHSFPVESTPTGDGSEYEILATNPCVAEGTLVNTPDGYRRVEDVEVGDEISTVLGSEPVEEIEVHEDYEVFRVEFSDGGSLDVTAQHRFHVLREDKQVEKIPLHEVEEGDHVRLHPTAPAEAGTDEQYQRELKRGVLLGDGCYTDAAVDRNHVHISTSVDDGGYNERVKALFGEDNFRADDNTSEGKATKMVLSDGGAVVQQLELDPAKAPGKSFDPAELTTEAEVMGVLDGLLASDGNVNLYSNHPQIRWDTASEELAQSIRCALLSVGIHGRITAITDPKRGGSINGRKISANHPKYTVNVSGSSARRYAEKSRIDEIHPEKGGQMLELRTEWMTTGNTWKAKVESIEPLEETTTVYDLYCSGSDTWITEGYVQQGCGEQPLMEYEACNLGHINLSTAADLDAPDWRVWHDEHGDEYDDLDAAVSAFLNEAIDRDEFADRIEWGTRFLENVVTMSDFPVDKIGETVHRNRKIGLGIMGLAQLYIQLGVRYGSEVGNEIARQLMMQINHGSKRTSHDLAEVRGSFANWADSKYADPLAHREWFEHQTGESADDWADGYPIRNHNTTTIAPTGTTSMVGNTTGGCEPIYNVAYYKNVSDDVQGDEMLVEFDDYFLRTLEANDIDVEAVKAEAQEQMANNAFEGVASLETVPTAIGDLFVITSDLSAKQHAAVQCACQEGVDSAISKTTNAPNDATLSDAKDVFEYVYEHGGKGVTYYRDGTRSKQVLTTRADNAEFADMDEDEAAEALLERIEEVFGGLPSFMEREDVHAELETSIDELVGAAEGEYAEKRPRPEVLYGVTQRIETGYGKVYVNINEDDAGRPFELFATIGNSGGFTNSFTEALAKTVSTALRSGVDPEEIASELEGIRSPKVAWDKGEQIQSIPDAMGTAMRRYLDGDIDRAYPQQRNLDEIAEDGEDLVEEAEASAEVEDSGEPTLEESDASTDGGGAAAAHQDATRSLIDAGESPECPDCGSMSLYFSEGCKTCESCGWSEC